jgi:F0F1-type ATP synthase assembly protein I
MQPDQQLHHLARDIATRAVVAVGLAGIALIHLLDSIGKFHETRYVFWLYVALMLGSLAVAAGVLHVHRRSIWLAAAGLAASAIAGYVISRTVGLPSATDDIGNWTEPLGLASLFVEGTVVGVSLYGYVAESLPAAIAVRPSRATASRATAG